jgi:hypothetical protein
MGKIPEPDMNLGERRYAGLDSWTAMASTLGEMLELRTRDTTGR